MALDFHPNRKTRHTSEPVREEFIAHHVFARTAFYLQKLLCRVDWSALSVQGFDLTFLFVYMDRELMFSVGSFQLHDFVVYH